MHLGHTRVLFCLYIEYLCHSNIFATNYQYFYSSCEYDTVKKKMGEYLSNETSKEEYKSKWMKSRI